MKAGQILERAFGLYRQHWVLFASLMAPAAILATAVGVPLRLQRTRIEELVGSGADPLEALRAAALMLLALGGVAAVSMMAYGAAWGAVTIAVEGVVTGRAMTARQAYAAMGGKAAGLALLFLVGAALAAAVGAIAAVPFAAVAFVGAGSLAGALAAMMSVFLGMAALAGVWIVLLARYGLVVQAVVLDDLGAIAALGRSSSLTRGRRGRVLLIFLIVILVTSVGLFLVQGPFEVAGLLAADTGGRTPIWAEALSALAGCAGSAILWPLLPIALTLLHRDLSEGVPLPAPAWPGGAAQKASDA